MKNQRKNRIRAYRYIVEQAKKLNRDLERKQEQALSNVDYVSLNELLDLKEGLRNPSQELVVALKNILSPVASATEIEEYLTKPFL